MEQQVDVRGLSRAMRRESHGLMWQIPKVTRRPTQTSRQTQWASPDAMVRFRNGMTRKEGSTDAGVAWFLSES